MRLLLEQPYAEEKRTAVLDEIYFQERQLQRLDYLRHEIRKTQTMTGGTKR